MAIVRTPFTFNTGKQIYIYPKLVGVENLVN